MFIKTQINTYLNKTTEAAPLAAFRVCFGILMLVSLIRFWYYGWIEQFYIEPAFFFSYYGFEFVKPLGQWTYLLFIICGLSTIGVTLGFKYRWSILIFFLSFTYIELMDKTTYLNHYYFLSILSFLMIFLPAGHYFSVDAKRSPDFGVQQIPVWSIDAIKLLLGIVYFYAGLAKLNYDWLVNAMPLKIWLPGRYDLPLVGDLLQQEWVHYAFSWGGAVYDLTIPFLLLWRRTRILAFVLVVIFHVMTRILFPIGMFPYIMIVGTLIFFDAKLHHRFLAFIARLFHVDKSYFDNGKILMHQSIKYVRFKIGVLTTFFIFQLIFPFRFLLYPGHLFWTEQGYRFSWRVMLMEKAGYANFKIVNAQTGERFYVDNRDFLNSFQEKQMSTQPDFIIQYAHYLGHHFASQGHENVQVFVESYVALNGERSRPYIDPDVDLMTVKESFAHKKWILPFDEK